MGGYANETIDVRRTGSRVRGVALVSLWLAWLIATPAFAGPPPATQSDTVDRERPVSTRPAVSEGADGAERNRLERGGIHPVDVPPRTRAAARRQIEQMSPTQWLSQYGAVTIGPRPH
jgi:hypothetical protein